MPRPLRIDYAGAFHHVTMRGAGKLPLFLDDADRLGFLKRLAELRHRWGLKIHAYCLMTNHYHLEVETSEPNLSKGMQWLNHAYSAFFNWRHERSGHLFDGRFRNAIVEAETHLHALTRYIHLNPVRAGLAEHPADYTWSSYRAYIGFGRPPVWLETQETLGRFGKTASEQLKGYRSFVEAEIADNPARELAYGMVIGTAQFVDWVREKLDAQNHRAQAPATATARKKITLAQICALAARSYNVAENDLRAKGRKRNEARDLSIYLSRERSSLPNAEIGAYYGGISGSAVSSRSSIIEKKALADKAFRSRIAALSAALASANRE